MFFLSVCVKVLVKHFLFQKLKSMWKVEKCLTFNGPPKHICPLQETNVASKPMTLAGGRVKNWIYLKTVFVTSLFNLIWRLYWH